MCHPLPRLFEIFGALPLELLGLTAGRQADKMLLNIEILKLAMHQII